MRLARGGLIMHFNKYARMAGRRRALMPAWLAFGLLLTTAGPVVSATASVTRAHSQSSSKSSSRAQSQARVLSQARAQSQARAERMTYRGYTFKVPRTWRVIRL